MKIFSANSHYFLFEVISIITSIWVMYAVLCFSLFYKFNSGLSKDNFGVVKVFFTTKLDDSNPKISADITFLINDIEYIEEEDRNSFIEIQKNTRGNYSDEGYIIVNKKIFKNLENSTFSIITPFDNYCPEKVHSVKRKSELIQLLNSSNFQNSFIFKDNETVSLGHSMLTQYSKYISDIFVYFCYDFLFLFVSFMKYTLSRMNFILFKKWRYERDVWLRNSMNNKTSIKNENFAYTNFSNTFSIFSKRFFFSSIFFHLSIILIIPTLYSRFYELDMDIFLGFKRNYFYSFFFDRNILYPDQKSNLNIFVDLNILNTEKFQYKNNFFFIHSADIFEYKHYNYVINILLLCLIVWISGFYKNTIFEKLGGIQPNTKISQNDNNLVIPKSCKNILYNIIFALSFMGWGILLIIGFINFVDNFYFYHLLVFRNFYKLFDWVVGSYLILTYIHIYLYIFLIVYSIRMIIQERKRRSEANRERGYYHNSLNQSILSTSNMDLLNVTSETKRRGLIN